MINKGFYEVLPDAYICLIRNNSAPLLPEEIVKFTHLAAQKIHRGFQLK